MYYLLPQRFRKLLKKLNQKASPANRDDCGFSIVEATIAMVILLIALLGVFVVYTYAISYNSANESRADGLAILQQEFEILRSSKFTPSLTDLELSGGNKMPRLITLPNGNEFIVQVVVDDDPDTIGVQIAPASTIKEITLTVTLARPTPGWQFAVPNTILFRRVRSN